jgi:PTS system mannose-specific IIC component
MEISVVQAIILGFFACLSSMPGLAGTSIGNYTLGRPLVAGLIVGLILGDIKTGIIVGAAIQVVYIALITPGGAVAADVRAISYIGIPLSIVAINGLGIDPSSTRAVHMATALGAAVGTLGTVLFYGTVMMNLIWQAIGLKAVQAGDFKKLYLVNMGFPWISHLICSFLPTFIVTIMGASMVEVIKTALPMDGIAMKTLFTVGSLLPAVGIAILLKQVVLKTTDLLTFCFGFTLSACMGINLIGAAVVGGFFAILNYKIKILQITRATNSAGSINGYDDEEEI